MSNNAARHYETLLAAHYSWMTALPFDDKVAEQRTLLGDLGIAGPGLAIDLGSGPGYQAFALAELGFEPVIALDTSEVLLAELATADPGERVRPIVADIRDLANVVAPQSAAVIICMGDTLTHLESREEVRALLDASHTTLEPGG